MRPIHFFPVKLTRKLPLANHPEVKVVIVGAYNPMMAEAAAKGAYLAITAWVPFWVPEEGYASAEEAKTVTLEKGYPLGEWK